MKDHQIDEFHRNFHKTDIAVQIFKTICTAFNILDQTLVEVTNQTITETPHLQILEINTTLTTAQGTLLTINSELIQIAVIEITQITDHKTILKWTIQQFL